MKGTALTSQWMEWKIDMNGIKIDKNWKKCLAVVFVHEKFPQLFQEQEAIQVEHGHKSLEGIS